MLVSLCFDSIDTVIVDHTRVMIEVEYDDISKKDKWYAGVYIEDNVERKEIPLNPESKRTYFALSGRRLLNKKSFNNVEDANLYANTVKDYVNKQVSPDVIVAVGGIPELLELNTKNVNLIEALVELLKPKPKAPRKKKETKE